MTISVTRKGMNEGILINYDYLFVFGHFIFIALVCMIYILFVSFFGGGHFFISTNHYIFIKLMIRHNNTSTTKKPRQKNLEKGARKEMAT